MRFFLDTEWADTLGSELVSLALVAEDGEFFYAERDTLPEHPTDFVRQVVYRQLDRGPAARTDEAMTQGARAFLVRERSPVIYSDYANDLQLLQYVLAGFDLSEAEVSACGPVPAAMVTEVIHDKVTLTLVEAYFEAHPHVRARRHHALVDAEALRQASLVSTGRTPCPPWAVHTMRRLVRAPNKSG
ncbi:3'-5' exoribonuclease [Xanthomonas campestris pv. zingibericola]|uniref:3'-5' exoribonuclease n=1 Tax=Xanthomonas euvesicatoria TaxID=456327 RepID=UPI001C441E80|nr:3'-5' exoribonuclease [Xanthomonas euvesicatoria]MBV6859651.1 3'-5' exoribonuclease [Xanthomonas campestris pv. zingibericola]